VPAAVAAALLLFASSAPAQTTVAAMYADTMAKERAVRDALAGDTERDAALKALRTVVAEYDALVRRYPTSGYCDDALWHAAQLSADAFSKYGEAQDRTAATRSLRRLAAEYPSSKFAKQAPGALAAFDGPVEAPRPADGRSAQPLATIRDVRRQILGDTARVIVELDREVPFHQERLDNPPRMFVDLGRTKAAPALIDRTLRFDDRANLVRQIRIGRHPGSVTRVVLDTIGVSECSVYPLYGPYRLVIDCVRRTAAAPDTPMTARPVAASWGALPPAVLPAAGALLDSAKAAAALAALPPQPPVIPAATARAALPARNLAGGFSLARQLGLAVARIVIDPGHGGHDPGATGKGVAEAELVLDIALRLEKLLAKVPGLDVILTRRTDEYVPLEERTAIANREGADLFLSIHANASGNTRAGGVETYFLNFATSLGAAAVAARENAASGHAMGALPDLVKSIALHNKLDESRDFATFVQRAMVERLKGPNKSIRDLGVKQAPFVVLIGAAMPSVLAEVSFVTNTQEARLLRTTAYRQHIAEALLNAIRKYQTSLKTASGSRTSARP
jgi:N-acetylmuramoyl-L-alanine amidase